MKAGVIVCDGTIEDIIDRDWEWKAHLLALLA